jgi:hypothetical protein
MIDIRLGRGIEAGVSIDQQVICSAISRVLSAADHWTDIISAAANPQLQIVISNTTEVGVQLVKESIFREPPVSFPAKLLAFLYERFKIFNGDPSSGMIIIPTELLMNNGEILKAILLELAEFNNLESYFIEWLDLHNRFCNSLVDRIVPGKPEPRGSKVAIPLYDPLLDENGKSLPLRVEKLLSDTGDARILFQLDALPSNGRRIVRALEVIELTGERFRAAMPEPRPVPGCLILGLQVPRERLDARIAHRVDQMWEAGLVPDANIGEGLRRATPPDLLTAITTLAGEDTTANTIAWIIHLLWRHPVELQRATDEVRRALCGEVAGYVAAAAVRVRHRRRHERAVPRAARRGRYRIVHRIRPAHVDGP